MSPSSSTPSLAHSGDRPYADVTALVGSLLASAQQRCSGTLGPSRPFGRCAVASGIPRRDPSRRREERPTRSPGPRCARRQVQSTGPGGLAPSGGRALPGPGLASESQGGSGRGCLGRNGGLVEHGLECAVVGGVVGLVVLPASPDDVQPGPGHDPHGVRVAVPAGAGPLVELCGPRVGKAGVGGEVADRVAELFVGRPAAGPGPARPQRGPRPSRSARTPRSSDRRRPPSRTARPRPGHRHAHVWAIS